MVSTAAWKVCVYENLSLVVLHTHLLCSTSETKTLCLLVKAMQLFERQHGSNAGTLFVSLLLLYSFSVKQDACPASTGKFPVLEYSTRDSACSQL